MLLSVFRDSAPPRPYGLEDPPQPFNTLTFRQPLPRREGIGFGHSELGFHPSRRVFPDMIGDRRFGTWAIQNWYAWFPRSY